jgi:transcription elongation factor GreB
MGRWRPPAPNASPYITPAGFVTLQKELDELWLRRRGVVKALAEAAAEGDRSENAEYIYRKKELAGIDRRIRYLQKRLPSLKVVRERPTGSNVYFGAIVEIRDSSGASREVRIVGPDEADSMPSGISVDSPVAKALLGKQAGGEARVTIEGRESTLTVVSVRYTEP